MGRVYLDPGSTLVDSMGNRQSPKVGQRYIDVFLDKWTARLRWNVRIGMKRTDVKPVKRHACSSKPSEKEQEYEILSKGPPSLGKSLVLTPNRYALELISADSWLSS